MRHNVLCSAVASLCIALAVAEDATLFSKHRFRLPFQPPGLREIQAKALRTDYEDTENTHSSSIPYVEKWFTQKVDHADPSNTNTFQQRYWIGTTFYKPGGPVIVLEGGETSGAGRIPFMQTGIGRYLTEALGGIGVVLEHRYYGKSYVTENLTAESLKYLDTAQSLADNAYFAENLWKELPEEFAKVRPSHTPFISYGGSYAGAKSAFLQIEYPETYYGSLASSAVIWAGENFWEYNEPLRFRGDPTCVAILRHTAGNFDRLQATGGEHFVAFKKMFGLEELEDRDAANVLALPLEIWQEGNWNKKEAGAELWDDLCATLTAGVNTWSHRSGETHHEKVLMRRQAQNLELGVANYARWIKRSTGDLCGDGNIVACLGTWDESKYQNVALSEEWRLWQWQVCTEWGYFVPAAPDGHPTLVSRLVDMAYHRRICQYAFGMDPSFKIDVSKVLKYGGFNLTAPRLMYIDGTHDPWLYATAHSPYSGQKDRDDKLSVLIEESWHHNDENGLGSIPQEPKRIQDVHNLQVEVVREWVGEFYRSKELNNV